MSHRTARLAALTLLACVALPRAAAAQGGAPAQQAANVAGAASHKADEQAIRTLSQQWLAAQRSKNVDAVMANFTPDAVAVYGGHLLNGAAAIRKNHESDIATYAKTRPDYTPWWKTTSVVVSQAGDMAYESGTFDDSWNGGKSHERGYYLTVWRKIGGEWKVVRDMAAPEPSGGAMKPPT